MDYEFCPNVIFAQSLTLTDTFTLRPCEWPYFRVVAEEDNSSFPQDHLNVLQFLTLIPLSFKLVVTVTSVQPS